MPSPDEIKRIVVAIDLSVEHAKRCVSFATHLASSPGCETIILTIIKNSDIIDSEGRIDHVKLQKAEGEARNVHEELVIRGNMFDFQSIVKSEFIKSDDVANAICDYCRGVDADVVIVGRRSLGFLEGVLLGSVSGKVVKNAPCSILVVK